jgi:hypothetical protein
LERLDNLFDILLVIANKVLVEVALFITREVIATTNAEIAFVLLFNLLFTKEFDVPETCGLSFLTGI